MKLNNYTFRLFKIAHLRTRQLYELLISHKLWMGWEWEIAFFRFPVFLRVCVLCVRFEKRCALLLLLRVELSLISFNADRRIILLFGPFI